MVTVGPGVDPVRKQRPDEKSMPGPDRQVRILVKLYNRCLSYALSSFLQQADLSFTVRQAEEADENFAPTLLLTDLPSLEQDPDTRWPTAKIILFDEGLDQQQLERALSHPRVSGLIRGNCDDHLLLKAIRCVENDEVWIDSETVKTLLHHKRNPTQENPGVHLTNKEKQIIDLILQGLKNKEIASLIYLSESTVKVYISRIYRKFQVTTRPQLIHRLTRPSMLN